jgi:mxaJ protein
MKWALALTMAGACLGVAAARSASHRANEVLRVCADPNNLPFSNDRSEGFENRIATLIASDLGGRVEYTWWAQRRGFVRNTLNAGTCDVILGVPVGYGMVRTTRPYYRSTYVFVTRRDRGLHITSLNDPALRRLRVGVHLIGDDYANSPAAHSLARRGLTSNVIGYTLYGDYSKPNPPARLIDAVVNREVDVAVAWGPLAGYFAKKSKIRLDLAPVTPERDGPLRYAFDISLGVKKHDRELKDQLDKFLTEHREEIDRILNDYNVPRVSRERQLTSAK